MRVLTRQWVVTIGLLIFMVLAGPGWLVAQSARAESGTPTAAEQIRFALNPKGEPDGSFFELEAKPGSSTRLTVEFSNQSAEPLKLRSFVSDVYTLINGGFGVSDEGNALQPPTPWIDYPADTYDLAPGEGREVTFLLAIPKDAKPGNYVSALVLQTADPIAVEGTALFNQIIRKAIAIDLTIPGEMKPAFSLGDVVYKAGDNVQTLSVGLTNSGNARLRPSGSLSVKDASGTEIITMNVAMGSVFAGTSTLLQLVLQQPLAPGEYTLSLDLTDEKTGAQAELKNAPFTATEAPASTGKSLISFVDLAITPAPDATAPQFISISGSIANGSLPIASARLTLKAFKDGKEIESFVLFPSLSLPQGETPIQQRYIPATGFTPGTWSFSLVLESLDPASGAATLLIQQELEQTIVVR